LFTPVRPSLKPSHEKTGCLQARFSAERTVRIGTQAHFPRLLD
jgi:hypothetical protein